MSRKGRAVLIGDHKQLPPVCLSERAQAKGLGLSLFDRLLSSPGLAPSMLEVQYRMHPLIRQWPSKEFYGSRLRDGIGACERQPVRGFHWPAAGGVAFIESGPKSEEMADGASRLNRRESTLVGKLVEQLLQAQLPADKLGVISPYRGQVRLLQQHINGGVEVRTVDGFQGREKDVIIISCVRSNPKGEVGFLDDPRRLNVMLTRAKRGLIVVGNRATLQHNRHWSRWFIFVDEHQLLVEEAAASSST